MPTKLLKLIQCPDCGDLRVDSRPCPPCEPDDPIIAALRRQEQAQSRRAAPRPQREWRLLPRLLALPLFRHKNRAA
jgi:hypothetical protein